MKHFFCFVLKNNNDQWCHVCKQSKFHNKKSVGVEYTVDSSRSSLQGEWRISRIFSSQYYFLSFYKIFSPHQLKSHPT